MTAGIRTSGLANGADAGSVGGRIGIASNSVSVPGFGLPSAVAGLPRITGGQFVGQTWGLETTGLTGISNYVWEEIAPGSSVLLAGAGAATFDTGGHAMKWVRCVVTCDQGTLSTPAKRVYMAHMEASHSQDDQRVLDLVPHETATHIAVQDGGNWSSPATWLGGRVPGNAARVLIPYGIDVTYDVMRDKVRLKTIRVDGTLTTDVSVDCACLFETLVITQGATFTDGVPGGRRPLHTRSEWIVSSRDPYLDTFTGGLLDQAGDDPHLLGRGIINLGVRRMWGGHKTSWVRTAAGQAPMAGDTSLTLARSPTGWAVGDTIAIGGTSPSPKTLDTEERVITAISGSTVSWSGPLIYNHDAHNLTTTRTDLQPAVANLNRNIVIRSEDPDVPFFQRGHTMDMHMACIADIWDVEHRDLGRTLKEQIPLPGREVSRQINDTDRQFLDETNALTPTTDSTMSGTTNVKSRYSIHIHFAGFNRPDAQVPIYQGCVVRGSIGWAMVHHGCEARMNDNVIHDFRGAGMVSETGNETGEWVHNCVMKTPQRLPIQPKNVELNRGLRGDGFRIGQAFVMQGRAMRVTGNFAMDCSSGYVFYHRNQGPIVDPMNYTRAALDMKDLQGPAAVGDTMKPRDYPIIHFNGNEAAGCTGNGFFVTKGVAGQDHGLNINLKNFKVWGIGDFGLNVEYVVQYAISDLDAVGCDPAIGENVGTAMGANAAYIAWTRPRTESCSVGVLVFDSTANYPHAEFDINDNPKYMLSAQISTNDTLAYEDRSSVPMLKVYETAPPPVAVSTTLPFKLADWSGSTSAQGDLTNGVSGFLVDGVSALAPLPSNIGTYGWGAPLPQYTTYLQHKGYWSVEGTPYLIFPLYFADRLTAEPVKTWHGVEMTNGGSGTNNGSFIRSPNPPVVATATLTVARGQTGSIDILALASDADAGTTLTLSDSYFKADHGRTTVSGSVVSFTPDDFEYTGPDKAFFWVEDGQGNSTRVDLNITIT